MIGNEFSVTVARKDVLDKLCANLTSHQESYARAVEAFYDKANQTLKDAGKSLKKRPNKSLSLMLAFPLNYEDSYKTAIEMLEMEVNDNIVLSRDLFVKFVKDEWEWRNQFAAATLSYLK
jgi:hypothetical protein